MKFKCDMCGKTFKVEHQVDIETHLKYSHSFQDIPLIKKYAAQTFKIHKNIERWDSSDWYYECSDHIVIILKSLLENE